MLPLFSGDAERVLAFARRAEERGFDGVFAFDHLFPPGAPADRPSLEAFTTLAAVAAQTNRVAVGTLVTRATLRSPGMLAKIAASIDDVSGGRMILGIGTGDPIDEPEHRVFGIQYLGKAERREHLVETVRAIKALYAGVPWEGGRTSRRCRDRSCRRPCVRAAPRSGSAGSPTRRPPGGRRGGRVERLGDGAREFGRKARLLRDTAGDRPVSATWAGIVVVGRDDAEVERLLDSGPRAAWIPASGRGRPRRSVPGSRGSPRPARRGRCSSPAVHPTGST